jgi:hypothetical protein
VQVQLTTRVPARFDLNRVKGLGTAADKVHDLKLIAFIQASLSPEIPRDNFAIELNGHAIGFHAEDFHKGEQSERGASVAEFPLFPIDVKFHLPMRIPFAIGELYSARRSTNLRVEVRP